MMPWEQAAAALGPTVKPDQPEAKLVSQVQTTPAEDSYDAGIEAKPWVSNELDSEIARTKDPRIKGILLAEKQARQANLTPATAQPTQAALPPWEQAKSDGLKPWEQAANEQTPLQKATGSAMSAVDFITGMPGMVGQGLAGIGSMVAGDTPDQTAQNMDKVGKWFQVSHWLEQAGVPKAYLHNDKAAETLSNIINWAPEHAGGAVYDFAKSHGISDSTAVSLATQVHTLVSAGELGLPVHSMLKGGKLSPADIKAAREKQGYGPVIDETPTPSEAGPAVTEGMNLPPDASMAPEMQQGDMFGQPGVADMPWKTDDNGMPYKDDISQMEQPGLFDPQQMDMAPKQPLPGQTPDMFDPDGLDGRYRKTAKTPIDKTQQPPNTLPPDYPVNRDEQGNLVDQGYYVDNIERQGQDKPTVDQGPDSIPYYPDNPTGMADEHRANAVDQAWDQFSQGKTDDLGTNTDNPRRRNQPPLSSRGFGGKQRGGIDISGLADLADRLRGNKDQTSPKRGLDARLDFLRQRYNELSNSILAPDTPIADRDRAREELRTTRLFLKETIDRMSKPSQGTLHDNMQGDIFSRKGNYDSFNNDIRQAFQDAKANGRDMTFTDIRRIVSKNNLSKFERLMFDRIHRLIPNVPIRFIREGTDRTLWGRYHPLDHSIDINLDMVKNPVQFTTTVLHEGMHAVMHNFIERNPFHPLVHSLENILEAAKDGSTHYGLTNIHEMVSEAFSNPQFMDFLRGKDTPPALRSQIEHAIGKKGLLKTLADGFYKVLGKVLGFDSGHDTLLKAVMDTSNHLMNSDITKESIAKNVDEMRQIATKRPIDPVNSQRTPEGLSKDNMNDLIAGYLTTSRTPESFKTKLDIFSDDPNWVNNVVNKADDIWADRANFLNNYKGSVFSKLSPTEQKLTADLRSGAIFEKEEQPKELPRSADLSLTNRVTSPTSVIRRISNPLARKWLNWAISNAQEYANMGTKLYARMSSDMSKFSQLSRKDQLGLVDHIIKLDGTQNDTLRNAGLQWATADMLRKAGLNDYQIEAYQHMTKALDKSWNLIRQVFNDQGREPPPRIPGYFPHVWLGSYKVLIADANGLHTIRAFRTAVGRKIGEQAAKKEFPNDIVTTEDPSTAIHDRDVAETLVQALQVFQNKDGLSQAILAKLTRMDESQTRGIIKEALEREGVHGYTAEDGIKTDLPGLGRGHNDRMLVAYQRYLEHVSNFWVNSQIATHVKGTINKNGHVFDNTPQLRRYLDDFISTATGHSSNHDAMPTEALREIAVKLGLPPNTIPKILSDLGKYTVMVRLRIPNPRFMIANLLQPITQFSDLMQVHADRILAQERGENVKLGSVTKAVATVTAEMLNVFKQGQWSPWAKEALKYARDNNKITVFMADHVDPIKSSDPIGRVQSMVLDKPNNWIEERGRVATFLGHVAYNLDAGMPKREAYEAAANQIDLAMGNYNKMHQPTMYSNFGLGGQLIRPFALLRNTYLGKFAMALQTLGESMKTSPRAAAAAGANVGSYIGSWILFAGAVGAVGFNEIDALIKMYNESFDPDTPLPRMGTMMRKIGMPNWLLYGLVSTATGVNIGPSLAAPTLTEAAGIPAFDTGKNFLQLGIQAIQSAQDTGMDQQKFYAAARKLAPNIAQPWIEKMIADKQAGVTPQATTFDNGYRRTPQDFAIAAMTGAHSLNEQNARDVHSLEQYEDNTNKEWKKQQVSKIVDSMLGIGPDNASAIIRKAVEANRGFDSDSLKLAIKKELDRRITDFQTQQLQDLKGTKDNAEKLYKTQRYMDLNRMNK